MKIIRRLLLSILIFAGLTVSTFGQNIILKQSNESGIYKKGEQIQISVFLNEMKSDSITLKIRENYREKTTLSKIKYSGESVTIFDSSFQKPASIIFEVIAGEKTTSSGLVVAPEQFEPATKRPKDFDKYWKQEKKGN